MGVRGNAVVVESVRAIVAARGAAALVIDDLRPEELQQISWSGSPRHIQSVGEALKRAPRGGVDYLVVRGPSGKPVAKGGVDYEDEHGPGKLWQLATHPALQSLGLGTRLIGELEHRIRDRGLALAWLGVEAANTRARQLYERLGYIEFGREREGWEAQRDDGELFWYETDILMMRRQV